MVGIASSTLLMFYFVVLGYPSENSVELDRTEIVIRQLDVGTVGPEPISDEEALR